VLGLPAYAVGRQVAAPAKQRGHRKRTFTRAEIEHAIREWVERYGDVPSVADLEPSRARRAGHEWRAERFESGSWPGISVVRREYGTLGAAIAAAGFRPPRRPSRTRPKLLGPDEILEAIREWTRRYGEPPTMADWEPSRARRSGQSWRIERYRRGDWPSARSVRNHFGNFTGAVAAAGLEPRPRGQRQSAVDAWRAANREAIERLRESGPGGVGPLDLARRMRQVARARSDGEPSDLHRELIELAAGALRWADQITPTTELGRDRSRRAA
jgi:hypothetical protein